MEMTAVILAGGIGSRFAPFLGDKTLLPFLGKGLLQRTIEMVIHSGISQLVVVTNDQNHDTVLELQQQHPEVTFAVSAQVEPKGMADALLAVKHLLPTSNMIVMNAGDMVAPYLLPELLRLTVDNYALVTGMVTPSYQPLGYLQLDGTRVIGIAEKPGADNMPSDVANLVFHYFSQPAEFVELLEKASQHQTTDDIYEQALTELMHLHEVGLYRYEGPWQKLKFGHHMLSMVQFFLSSIEAHIDPTATIAPTATINGPVWIDAGAKILDGAIINGHAYIGVNALVGNNALVRNSVIEAHTTVGFGSEIVRSYVGEHCDLHHAYVGDSALEHHVHFGYNAHTANLRFDQKNVSVALVNNKLPTEMNKLGALVAAHSELGVNVTTLPGITIGAHCLVYPGCVIHQAIPDNSILKLEQQQKLVSTQS